MKSATPGAIPFLWEVPGQPALNAVLEVETSNAPMLVGLLDLEVGLDIRTLNLAVFGRGAGMARAKLFGLIEVAAEIDLRDSDVEGIGSRYFRVLNSADAALDAAPSTQSRGPASRLAALAVI